MSDTSSSTPPPLSPAPPPVPSTGKGMSIGCIIGLVVGVVGLLVLIIVAVLASLAIPAFQRVKAKASSAQTKVAIMDLEVAITAYQAQYNKLPDLAETDEKKIVESRGLLLKIIMGRHTPNDFGFYEPPPAYTTGKGRLITNDAGEFELLDPFGKMYHLHFDWDGDGSIPNPEHPGATIPAPVIIYSAGPDLAYDTWDDNVKSWGLLEQ